MMLTAARSGRISIEANNPGILIEDRHKRSCRSEEIWIRRDIWFVSRNEAVLFGIARARVGGIGIRAGSGARVCRSLKRLGSDGGRHGCEGPFFGGERSLASPELGLTVREFLFFFGSMLGLEPLLHPAVDFRVACRFRLSFRAGTNEKRKRRN
jgi:hypothetical protein